MAMAGFEPFAPLGHFIPLLGTTIIEGYWNR